MNRYNRGQFASICSANQSSERRHGGDLSEADFTLMRRCDLSLQEVVAQQGRNWTEFPETTPAIAAIGRRLADRPTRFSLT
jgi:hypothetical protein